MANTLVINVVDRSVAPLNHVNIAVINQPNPVEGYTATADEVAKLIQIPNYFITDENGEQVSGLNYYKYFPKSGGGGSVDTYTKEEIDEMLRGKVDVEEGYGLSQEDFTPAEKEKLGTIQNPMLIKGRVDTVSDLSNIQDPQVGWMYLVGLEGAEEFEEYVYTEDSVWEYMGTTAITVDSELSDVSENPVQNKVITGVIGDINSVLEGVL